MAGLTLVGGLDSGSRADSITLAPGVKIKQAIGGRIHGQIESESPAGIVVRVGGSSLTIPIEQIASIEYEGEPASLQLARSRESNDLPAQALELYKKAEGEVAGRPFILQAIRFHEAEVMAEQSLLEPKYAAEAIAAYRKFVEAYPKSRHLGPAHEALARLELSAGNFEAAQRELNELAKLPGSSDRAAVLKSTILSKQGKYEESITELDRLITRFPKNSPERRQAQLAKAQSLAGLKRFDQAETIVRELIKANPPEDSAVQAPAYNTLGDCMREANRPKDALIAYLHTDLLYDKNKEEHARALFQISRTFRQLKQDSRAQEIWQRLKQEYPRSPWLAQQSKP
jgi:tetratricopeptide (TPR) repeat protein